MGVVSVTVNGKDFSLPRDKVIAFRNFAKKIWNMEMFMIIMFGEYKQRVPYYSSKISGKLTKEDKTILSKLEKTIRLVNKSLAKYRFADASDTIYHFMWDDLASNYLETIKDKDDKKLSLSVFRYVYFSCLKLLHPFMPFVTECIWQETEAFRDDTKPLIVTSWPK